MSPYIKYIKLWKMFEHLNNFNAFLYYKVRWNKKRQYVSIMNFENFEKKVNVSMCLLNDETMVMKVEKHRTCTNNALNNEQT